MKAQMKAASRADARYAAIIESAENTVSVRDMAASNQTKMSFDDFISQLNTNATSNT